MLSLAVGQRGGRGGGQGTPYLGGSRDGREEGGRAGTGTYRVLLLDGCTAARLQLATAATALTLACCSDVGWTETALRAVVDPHSADSQVHSTMF